jgi:hypothetical protein
MTAQFPGIKPSERSFRLGQFPTKVYRALSGATVKRAFGNRAYGYELQLTQLIDHYNGTSGGFSRFTLPAETFAGMDATLTSKIQSPTQIKWEYTSPPEVRSVYVGRNTVTISLAGELDY